MAPHGGQARDTPLALRRVKRLGKRLGPERAVGHLALRYGARQALLRAFSNAKIEAVKKGYSRPTQAGNAATTIAPAQIAPEDRAAVPAVVRVKPTARPSTAPPGRDLCGIQIFNPTSM